MVNDSADLDDSLKIGALLTNIRKCWRALKVLLSKCSDHWGYEDPIYRYYHQSFKIYPLQAQTLHIVQVLQELLPGVSLNKQFLQIIADGTGKVFKTEDNDHWAAITRPILEAFFHARFFLEMAVRYGKELKSPPQVLPSGWAALLYLYNLR